MHFLFFAQIFPKRIPQIFDHRYPNMYLPLKAYKRICPVLEGDILKIYNFCGCNIGSAIISPSSGNRWRSSLLLGVDLGVLGSELHQHLLYRAPRSSLLPLPRSRLGLLKMHDGSYEHDQHQQ